MENFEKGLDIDVVAASLGMGLKDTYDLLKFLAVKLEGALPQQTTVRRGGWFLAKERPVEEITLTLADLQFQLNREGRGVPTAKILKLVSGVVLKTTLVPIETWLQEIATVLVQESERSEAARNALSRFVGE